MKRLERKIRIERKPDHVLRNELRRAHNVPWEKITEAMERGQDQKKCREKQIDPISKEALSLKSEIDPIMKMIDRTRMKRIKNFVAVCIGGGLLGTGLLALTSNPSSYGTFMMGMFGLVGVAYGALFTLVKLDERKIFPEMLKAREKVATILYEFSEGLYKKQDCQQLLSLSIPPLIRRTKFLTDYWLPEEHVANALKSGNITDSHLELDLVHQIQSKEVALDVLHCGLDYDISILYAERIVHGEFDGE